MSKKGKRDLARARARDALKEIPLPGDGFTGVMDKLLGRAQQTVEPYVDPKLYAKYRRTMLKRKRTPQEKAIDLGEKDAFRIRWVQWLKAQKGDPES